MLCYETVVGSEGIRRRRQVTHNNNNENNHRHGFHRSDEMEMIMSDLERANERALSSEREADQLRQQLTTASHNLQRSDNTSKTAEMEQAIDILKRSSLEVELTAKEKEISQLVEDVQKLQASLNKLRETTSTQIAHLEEELSNKTRAFQKLEDRMRNQANYEEIKRELNIMKSIEFSSQSDEFSGDSGESKAKTLEVLLLEKNKHLQTENTHFKVNNSEVKGPISHEASSDHFSRNSTKSENGDLKESTGGHSQNDTTTVKEETDYLSDEEAENLKTEATESKSKKKKVPTATLR